MNITELLDKVEMDSKQLDEIIDSIIHSYVKDLDSYVDFIRGILKDGQNPPTTEELEDFCMNLSTYIYYASAMSERLGIRDDIARAIYKEVYHSARNDEVGGTVQDKNSIAELASQKQLLVNMAYTRAYKIVNAKVDAAKEILTSCKKIITRRISELEITRFSGGR